MKKLQIVRFFWEYLKQERAWYLSPLVLLICVLTIVTVLVSSSPMFLPFIYAGF